MNALCLIRVVICIFVLEEGERGSGGGVGGWGWGGGDGEVEWGGGDDEVCGLTHV